jgi:hypothetical protein
MGVLGGTVYLELRKGDYEYHSATFVVDVYDKIA